MGKHLRLQVNSLTVRNKFFLVQLLSDHVEISIEMLTAVNGNGERFIAPHFSHNTAVGRQITPENHIFPENF